MGSLFKLKSILLLHIIYIFILFVFYYQNYFRGFCAIIFSSNQVIQNHPLKKLLVLKYTVWYQSSMPIYGGGAIFSPKANSVTSRLKVVYPYVWVCLRSNIIYIQTSNIMHVLRNVNPVWMFQTYIDMWSQYHNVYTKGITLWIPWHTVAGVE